jgi:hypothetical protein
MPSRPIGTATMALGLEVPLTLLACADKVDE